MLFEGEIVVVDDTGYVDESGVIKQYRTENETFGVDIGGKAFLEFKRGS